MTTETAAAFHPALLEPPEKEARPQWTELPSEVLSEIEKITGKIAAAEIAWGGYSPSACFRATAENGEKYFIKGSHPGQAAHGAKALRQEIHAYTTLKFLQQLAPRFHGSISVGDEDDWRLGIWDMVDGKTALPWTLAKTQAVVDLLWQLHSSVSRADVPDLPDGRESNHVSDFFLGERLWKRFEREDDSNRQQHFAELFEDSDAARQWLDTHLPALVRLQSGMSGMTGPEGVVHFDLRSDNILFNAEGRAVIVDWTDTCWGQVLLDIVLFAQCVAAESGIAPQTVIQQYEDVSGHIYPREDVLSVVATVTGYFADNAWRAVPQELPRLRWVQSICLQAGLSWLAAEGAAPLPGMLCQK
ncbi:MAG: aminoglycoside phosphotransferase family protein [Alphaproteobacteria bacterium]|nr:MAG: aminoglycoside phosphotransferase family protein [Alphaproteobacteria bacterium]